MRESITSGPHITYKASLGKRGLIILLFSTIATSLRRKYAIVIRKFERRLNITINDFPEIGIYGFEEDFENKEEDDDSKLAAYDPWTRERIRDAKEDEDEDEEDYNYYRSLYRR